MKRKYKLFFKSWYLSSVIVFCLLFGILGIFKAYENIRLIGFGEYRKAVEYEDGVLRFFDTEIEIINN